MKSTEDLISVDTETDLSVRIGSMEWKNPITTGSGTFGQGEMFEDFFDLSLLGALTTKSVSLEPRLGNKAPRIAETASGYLNAIGLQNPGVDEFIKKYRGFFEKMNTPVIVSVAGNSISDYVTVVKKISDHLPIEGIEINISCPNVKEKGLQFACSPLAAADLIREVRKATSLTLITKLTPNTSWNVNLEVASACVGEGSDALSAINTLQGMAIDLEKRRPKLGNIEGGLSGPAIKPVALWWTYKLAKHFDVPIIAMGGIQNAKDILEFIVAGATAVAVGTSNFYNPMSIPHAIKGLRDYLVSHRLSSITALRKTLLTEGH